MAPETYDPRQTSVAVGDDRKKRGGWLWWLLALLAILAIIAILLLTSGEDDDTPAAAPGATPTAAQTAPPAATDAASAVPADGATLTAASVSLLGEGAASIKDQVGQAATGAGLRILSVDGSGFFVGTEETDRQFIEFGDRVGENEAQPYVAKVGDTVSLSGPVRPAPADPAKTLKLGEAAAQAVTDRGAYINADTVTPVG